MPVSSVCDVECLNSVHVKTLFELYCFVVIMHVSQGCIMVFEFTFILLVIVLYCSLLFDCAECSYCFSSGAVFQSCVFFQTFLLRVEIISATDLFKLCIAR